MLAAGTTLGPHKILAPLGAGGMGEVYRAEDPKHRRHLAIKVLDPEVAAFVGSERFSREIEITPKLTHPHILPVYDSRSAEGLLYYVMPHVEGESLRQRLSREKQLPVEDTLRIARELADALSSAHGHGVVHRDIKPENIRLESEAHRGGGPWGPRSHRSICAQGVGLALLPRPAGLAPGD